MMRLLLFVGLFVFGLTLYLNEDFRAGVLYSLKRLVLYLVDAALKTDPVRCYDSIASRIEVYAELLAEAQKGTHNAEWLTLIHACEETSRKAAKGVRTLASAYRGDRDRLHATPIFESKEKVRWVGDQVSQLATAALKRVADLEEMCGQIRDLENIVSSGMTEGADTPPTQTYREAVEHEHQKLRNTMTRVLL